MNMPVLLPMPRELELLPGQVPADLPVRATIRDALPAEGYDLRIADNGIALAGGTPAGIFYGRQTLTQLRRQYGATLPALHIVDWPDFPARGVMLDISRDKVPTLPTLFALVELLAELKYNQLQLYTEHTFAYRHHETVWRDASPLTAADIRELDAYCRARFIELVPNQNSFGHLERWLKHEPYKALAEAPDGAFYWGAQRPPSVLCPLDPRSIALVRELHAELLPCFASRLFNVGCDETMDLGKGRSKVEAERVGTERLYLEFLKEVHRSVTENGCTMMFWGDIILHKPELVGELPHPIIALEWGYEASHPFDRDCAVFAQSGVPFYVCPGTSSWNSFVGRTDNCLANLRAAAAAGLEHGACGYLVTDWGDNGHPQYLPVSYLAYAAGAAYAWAPAANRDVDLVPALDAHVFRLQPGSASLGRIAYDLGNLYQHCGTPHNHSRLFTLLVAASPNPLADIDGTMLHAALGDLQRIVAPLPDVRLDRADGDLVRAEFANNAEMVRLACLRGLAEIEGATLDTDAMARLRAEHKRLWLARNRPGGLADSLKRLGGEVS